MPEILGKNVTAVIGYGPQGRGQSLNLRDQGFNVVVGVKRDYSFENALKDGLVEWKNLVSIEEAAEKATIIQYLVSDAAQVPFSELKEGQGIEAIPRSKSESETESIGNLDLRFPPFAFLIS